MNAKHGIPVLVLLVGSLLVAGCGSPVQFVAEGYTYPSRAEDAPVDVIEGSVQRPHAVVGTLRVVRRIRPGQGSGWGMDSALDAILDEARRVGADAVVGIHQTEDSDRAGSALVLTATAVRYLQLADVVRAEALAGS